MECWSFEVAGKRDQQKPRLGTNIKHPDAGSSRLERKITCWTHADRPAGCFIYQEQQQHRVCRRRLFKEIDLKPGWLVFSDAPYFLEVVEDLGEHCHVIMEVWNPPDCISVSSKILAMLLYLFSSPLFSLSRYCASHLLTRSTLDPSSVLHQEPHQESDFPVSLLQDAH